MALTEFLREWEAEGEFYIWGGALPSDPASEPVSSLELMTPLVLVHPSMEGETGLWVGKPVLEEEYGEGKPGVISFPLRYGGGERVCLVEVDLAGLGEVEPLEVVARSEAITIEIEFTPLARRLSDGERDRGTIEREISLLVSAPGAGGRARRKPSGKLRLRLQRDRVVRKGNPALDGILGH
jgi:hypothetical protein